MKTMLLLLTLGITGCAIPHLEGTQAEDATALARLNSTDREARLVRLDDARLRAPSIGSYFVKPGPRKLEFQLQLVSGGPPGKNMTGGITPLNDFIEACVDLKPGYDYLIEVDKTSAQPVLVINERNAQSYNADISSAC